MLNSDFAVDSIVNLIEIHTVDVVVTNGNIQIHFRLLNLNVS